LGGGFINRKQIEAIKKAETAKVAGPLFDYLFKEQLKKIKEGKFNNGKFEK
jgi:hypothetical protein